MRRALRVFAWLAAWLAGGVLLSRGVLRLPVEMPEFLDRGIRFGVSLFGRDDLANPDDMEDIAFLVILAASFAVSALVVAAADFALARAFSGRARRL
jgi:hypothetical protein